jgi:hypothetical protein
MSNYTLKNFILGLEILSQDMASGMYETFCFGADYGVIYIYTLGEHEFTPAEIKKLDKYGFYKKDKCNGWGYYV